MQELATSHAQAVVATAVPSPGWPTAAPTATLVGCIANPHLDATCTATPAEQPATAVIVVATLALLLLARRAGPTARRFA